MSNIEVSEEQFAYTVIVDGRTLPQTFTGGHAMIEQANVLAASFRKPGWGGLMQRIRIIKRSNRTGEEAK